MSMLSVLTCFFWFSSCLWYAINLILINIHMPAFKILACRGLSIWAGTCDGPKLPGEHLSSTIQ